MKAQRFFLDTEADGLYGDILSIAALVTDAAGVESDHFYAAVRIEREAIESPWVKEHVFPYLSNAEIIFDSAASMLEAFWAFWMQHRQDADCITYIQYPVEARLFMDCVKADPASRTFLAPCPMYDLSTLLASKGYPFDTNMQALSGLPINSHDAMNDVRMMARVWQELIS